MLDRLSRVMVRLWPRRSTADMTFEMKLGRCWRLILASGFGKKTPFTDRWTTVASSREDKGGGQISASEFAQHARRELEFYRSQLSSFTATAEVRDDMFSGLLCSGGSLLIGHQTKMPASRVQALLQHEVGTHRLTYYNGLNEPFHQLHSGFAGYDALQEGLAVLSEFLVGGLSDPRLRMLVPVLSPRTCWS